MENNETKQRRRPRGTGGVFRQRESAYWYVGYMLNGEYKRESSKCLKKVDAQNFLKDRLKAIGNGNFMGREVERVTVDELWTAMVKDYRIHGQQVKWPERVWKHHISGFFGGMRASKVGTKGIVDYIERRRGAGAAKATINRELALLRRAFNLGFEADPQMVLRVPKFKNYIVSEKGNERKGFVEQAQYDKLAEKAAGKLWLRGLLAFAYTFGFRRGELGEMRRKQVDLLDRTIELYRGTTKNGEGRKVVMTAECYELAKELCRGKQPEDFLFTRSDGKPVRDFRESWDTLMAAARVAGLLFHDLRRSAVRNMVRRGVPQRVAREISGHKTDSIFERYNVTSDGDLAEAARKIEQGAKSVIHSFSEVGGQAVAAPESEDARKPS